MALEKTSRPKYDGMANPFARDFIIPPKASNAIKIVTPSSTTSEELSSSASRKNDLIHASPSSNKVPPQDGLLSFQAPKVGVPEFPIASPHRTMQSASKQAPIEEGQGSENLVSSGVWPPPSAQADHGLEALPPAGGVPRPAAESTLDIYASNYIPAWQRAINESPATQRRCCPLRTVDYAVYVSTFAGSRTLSTVPPTTLPPIQTVSGRIFSSPADLLPQQYGEYFSDAVQNEIAAQYDELKSFSMYQITFDVEDTSQPLYGFTIPGLQDYSPRVDLGDVVKIRPLIVPLQKPYFLDRLGNQDLPPAFSGFEFDAIVWGIAKPKERIVLRMDGFMPNLWRTCNIIFAVQEHWWAPLWRSIYLTAHYLTSTTNPSAPWLRQMLFPEPKHAQEQSSLPTGDFGLQWYDPEMNFEQQKAVDAVISANYGCVPYLISGPPGTGKTKTIVETALQLLRSKTAELVPHLLVCAPSDPAADTLATRLSAHLGPSSMLRLNGWTRSFAEVPENILPYTYTEDDLFSLPDFDTIMTYKVVVTTCKDADMLVQAQLTNEALIRLVQNPLSVIAPALSTSMNRTQLIHWTALLLDEAAQATEPEVLVPLSVVAPAFSPVAAGAVSAEWKHPVPQLVMAGDEYQLGPRLSLKPASPLASSLFARLFARPLYSAHPLARANCSRRRTSPALPILRPPFTNLIRNYRSHPAILTVPSALFYADTLITQSTTLSEAVRTWPGWQGADAFSGSGSSAAANRDAADMQSGNAPPQNRDCWPVLFVHHSGPDALESVLAGRAGAGLFNASEASVALSIVKSLLSHTVPLPPTENAEASLPSMQINGYESHVGTRSDWIQPHEIVVMSPFQAQVNCLRKSFREAGLRAVNIGPLDAFQGLESRIVVLCTTRTRLGSEAQGRDRFVREDQARGLGVIGEPKKFNVAITRAKEGLIVIGNKECLTCTADEPWVEFLAFWERSRPGLSASDSVSHNQRLGRLERALRYKEKLGRSRTEAGHEGYTVKDGSRIGVGQHSRQDSSRSWLRGPMPSLEDEMFQEGLMIANEMRNNADDNLMYDASGQEVGHHDVHEETEDLWVQNAREPPGNNVNPKLSKESALVSMVPAVNEEATRPQFLHSAETARACSETNIGIPNSPKSIGVSMPGAAADNATPVAREALAGIQFGSFHLPLRANPGGHIARRGEDPQLRRHEQVQSFDRDLEAEVERHERVDCATQ